MNINAIEELERVLGELDARIKHLESSPNRAFVLVEYETLSLFHWFNLCFKQFWDEFDRNSSSQLFQYLDIISTYGQLRDQYVSLFEEQIRYLEGVLDFKKECVKELPPVVFSEENHTDVIGYYKDYYKNEKGEDGKPLFEIDVDRDTHYEVIDGKDVPIDFYMFRSDIINDVHYKGLCAMYKCLNNIWGLMFAVHSYIDTLIENYKPSQDEIVSVLENESRQYAREIGKKVERDLRRTAQGLKPSRSSFMTSEVWGLVMDEEDDLYRLAITGQLEENKEKRFETIFEEQRKQLTDNSAVLQKIKNTAIDGELFDIRLSVETHNLLSSLNADNLDLFYELILRRNIIQREMFPDELGVVYEEWLNPPEEQTAVSDIEINDKSKECDNINQQKVNITTPRIVLQQLLQQEWFETVCVDKKQYSKEWRNKLVSDLMASEYGAYIARLWEHQEKIPTIKGKFIGTLILADVLRDNKLAASRAILGIDKNTRDKDEKTEASTFANYMGQCKSEPYVDWIKDYVTKSKEKA